jgi:hypothetical protein
MKNWELGVRSWGWEESTKPKTYYLKPTTLTISHNEMYIYYLLLKK